MVTYVDPVTPTDTQSSPRYLPIGQAAKLLQVHVDTLREWANTGKIGYWRTPGGQRRFLLSDIERIMAGDR